MLERSAGESQNQPGMEALTSLSREIEAHEKHENSRSYLGKAADFVFRSDENSLEALKKLQDEIQQSLDQGNAAEVARLSNQTTKLIQQDRENLAIQDEVSHYTGGFLKTASIFMHGRLGLGGAVAAHALDQMRPADDFRMQLADAALGGLKGGLLKTTFDVLSAKSVGIAAKGVALGGSSRLLELGLSRQTYDAGNGNIDLLMGLGNTVKGTFDRKALASDVVVFGLAHGLLGKANSLSGGAVAKNPFWNTVLTGTTFGLSSGSVSEITRQQAAGEEFDLGKVVQRSLIQGAIDTVAAAPGGAQARAAALSRRRDAGAIGDSGAGRPDLLGKAKPGAREFVVLEGQDVISALGAGKETSGWLKVREVLGTGKPGRQLGSVKNLFVQHRGQGEAVNQQAAEMADLLAFCNPETASTLARSKHVLSLAKGPLWLTPDASNSRIAFSAGNRPLDLGGDYRTSASVELGSGNGRRKTVVDVLSEKGHGDYAEALRSHPKLGRLQAVDFLGEGNESVAVELAPSKEFPDGGVLKLTIPEGGWNGTWGKRPFDARILSKVYELDGSTNAYAYVQELVTTMERYDPEMINRFLAKVSESRLEFQDPGADPTKQIGISDKTGEVVLIDYSAVDKPGANETHEQLVRGQDRIEEMYEAENRLDYKEEADQPERVYESTIDISLESRRYDVLHKPERFNLLAHQRSILEQLFQGASHQDAVILRAVEIGKFKPNGELDLAQAQAEVKEMLGFAKKNGLLDHY
ncbi:MAG TPA: hypothetical protein V6D08_18965 [Candidatus Obscuribacterales bacterium]